MAKKPYQHQPESTDVYTRTETFLNENKNLVTGVVVAILVVVGGFLGYRSFYVQPMEEEAQSQMFMAEMYFERDSFRLALYGDANYPGFLTIIDEYGPTDAANLAHYYAGISFLHMGDYEGALEFLEDFDADDEVVGAVALGAMGDAYMELGQTDKGISHYKEAAGYDENSFTSAIYLMKAAKALEANDHFEEAKEVYQTVKTKYPETPQGREVEKYIAAVEAKMQ